MSHYLYGASGASGFTVNYSPNRAAGTPWVVSTTQDSFVKYTVRLNTRATVTLLGGQTSTAQVDLQIRPTPGSGAFTTIGTARLSSTMSGGLVIGITVTNGGSADQEINSFIPAGYEAQFLITTSGTGTQSATITGPQEEKIVNS